MERSRESAWRSEFKGNLQKSPATLWHLLPVDGTICKGFSQSKAASTPSLEPHTTTTSDNLCTESQGEGELNTRKPALLHSSHSTDLSQLLLSIQLYPNN